MQVSFKSLCRHPLHCIAFGFGVGLLPKVPGTWGTLVAVPFYFILQAFQINVISYIGLVVLFALAGIWICGRTAKDLGVHDPGGIVWDEIVGLLCALIALPGSWLIVLLAFGLFRLFDILKPWPIGWLDKTVPGGLGIMLDDILAGLLSCAVLHLIIYFDFLKFQQIVV
ncbi:MAG: phosphatidylglycerophosphatase A [Gammaproteobacteria bacterium]|nr:phosphatidylglycerophosphatase A [Gammaproteobacteria bacterium]